jgi:hypothetical protein
MLTTIFAMFVTWYLTKIYYTRTMVVKLDNLEARGLVQEKCSKCSILVTTRHENLRTPFYCSSCK